MLLCAGGVGCGGDEATVPAATEPTEAELLSRIEAGGQTGCEAALQLADGSEAGYIRAYEAARLGADTPCATAARVRLGELEEHRPPLGALLAIDRRLGLVVPECFVETLRAHGGEHGARVVLELRGDCEPTTATLDATGDRPRRFVVSNPGLRRGAAPRTLEVGSGGARGLAFETDDGAESFVVELEPRAEARMFRLGERWLIDVVPEPEIGEQASRVEAVIVLDPGHGGAEIGGSFGDLVESTLVLDIAVRVQRRLRGHLPRATVVLTRTGDDALGLDERTAMANSLGADLFLSLHLNASDEPITTGGVTTFVLDATNDESALRLAARENGTRVNEVTGIQRLIARLHRREQVGSAREFAALLHEHTLEGGRRVLPTLEDRGVRSAMFYVLVGARMPAVLLEASFLSKPEEAAALRTVEYRDALADGIAEGIVRYLSRDQ